MNLKRKLLKDTRGYSLIELMVVMAIFSILIVPIYKMVVSSVKIQKASEETYEATLQAQSVLESVKEQIENDLRDEYEFKRSIATGPVKPWLKLPIDSSAFDTSLIGFLSYFYDATLSEDKVAFSNQYKTDTFLYEVHIWHLNQEKLQHIDGMSIPDVSFTAYDSSRTPEVTVPVFTPSNTSEMTMVEINAAVKEYFDYKENALLWINPNDPTNLTNPNLKAMGEIIYNPTDRISIQGNGIRERVDSQGESPNIEITPINGYETMPKVIKLSYERYAEPAITHRLIIEENGVAITGDDMIQFSIDLTTFKEANLGDLKTEVIRLENKTKARVIVPVYNENASFIEIYPIQDERGGTIVVEKREKKEPSKNFLIGIIVRDAFNSTFGEPNKVLSKLVDVYSFDYN